MLDGLGTEAGKAVGIQQGVARRPRHTSYNVQSAAIPGISLPHFRFVITLDADTILPRESAKRLVGTMAHPLNAPRFDPSKGRVVEGYGVLQPRVSYHLFAATRSRFASLLASSAGIDPYAMAVSDAYMDLFGLGSFTGKGIYDLDAFEAANGHAFPENRILSHDLIEGNFARCGLVTDVELFDDFPPRYHAYALREHRWARGDWQLLPWLAGTVPTAGKPGPNPLPTLERWKILDNLRRTLVPPSLVLLLVLGWTVLPGSPWAWTLFALAVPALPVFQLVIGSVYGAIRQGSFGPLGSIGHNLPATAGQSALWIAFLADQARRLLDAIVRTLARLFMTHKDLLEWETAAAAEHRLGTGIGNFFTSMWPSPAFATVVGLLVAYVRPAALPAALPVLAAWFASPLVAYWVSRPRRAAESPLTDPERAELRRIARKTWHFFETFVGDEDNWLPPDNYQEDSIGSGGRVAHRTSPTNKGMLLLSTLSAHDLGYLGLGTLLKRLEHTLRHLRPDGEARGAPLQLVQHPDAADPAAELRLDRGQRQPPRLPRHPQARAAGEAPRADPGARDAGRPGRHPGRPRRGRPRLPAPQAGRGLQGLRAGGSRPRRPARRPPRRPPGLGRAARADRVGRRRAWSGPGPRPDGRRPERPGAVGDVRRRPRRAGPGTSVRADARRPLGRAAPVRAEESTLIVARSRRSTAFAEAWEPIRVKLATPASPIDLAARAEAIPAEMTALEALLPEGDGRDPAVAALRAIADAREGLDGRRPPPPGRVPRRAVGAAWPTA